MRVLYTPLNAIEIGGLSTIAYRLGTNMDKEKIQIDFFATYKLSDNLYKKKIEQQNGRLFDFKINNIQNSIIKKFAIFKNFYKVLKENKYDIIHIHIDTAYNGFLFGIIAKLASKSKIIIHSHNSAISGVLKNFLHILFRPILGILGDEFVTCSTEAANWMYPKYILKKKKIKIIENGINVKEYLFNENIRQQYREQLNITNNFVIGHIGRFVTQKNHEFLIDIFHEIYLKNKDVKLILVGIGELENKIRQKVEKLKLNNNVLFLKSRNDVSNLLQAFDLFLLPSLYEGLPIVAIEAQASGVNTILSNNITKEAKIIPNIKYLSLNQEPKIWASEILKLNVEYDRTEYQQQILDSNFNIKKSALNLQEFYFEIMK